MMGNRQSTGPRIAIFLPSLEGGGAERVYINLANRFVASGLPVDISEGMQPSTALSR